MLNVSAMCPRLRVGVNTAAEGVGDMSGKRHRDLTCVYRVEGNIFVCQNYSFPRAGGVSCASEAARAPVFCGQPPVENW